MNAAAELIALKSKLLDAADNENTTAIAAPLRLLEEASDEVGRAFSRSWLGYHAYVYYEGLKPSPPGANFSPEWGLMDTYGSNFGSSGNWLHFDPKVVREHVFKLAGSPDLNLARTAANQANEVFNSAKSDILSILFNENPKGADLFLATLKEKIESLEIFSQKDVARHWMPKGQTITRDSDALSQGHRVPPHLDSKAEATSMRHSFGICRAAADI